MSLSDTYLIVIVYLCVYTVVIFSSERCMQSCTWSICDIIPLSSSSTAPPKVQVYSHKPGEFGKENTLICYVSEFHPPDITIQLFKDGKEITNANQTDLAFKQNWHFHLTKSAFFTPISGEKYLCKVTHGKTVKDYAWGKLAVESNMCEMFQILCQKNTCWCDAVSKVVNERRQ